MKWVRVRPSPRKARKPRRANPESSAPSSAPEPADESTTSTPDIALPDRLPSQKTLRFIDAYVASGCRDALGAARTAGFHNPSIARSLVVRYADLIASERLRYDLDRGMELDEAIKVLGGLARTTLDEKVKLASVRAVLELHGAIGGKGSAPDRSHLARELEKIIGDLRATKHGNGSKKAPRVRARLQMQVDVDTHPEESVTHTPDSAPRDVIELPAESVSHTPGSRAQD